MVSLPEKRQAVKYISENYKISARRACRLININRKTSRYQVTVKKREQKTSIVELSLSKPRWGYRKIYDSLRLKGITVGREKVRIVRKEEGLQILSLIHISEPTRPY